VLSLHFPLAVTEVLPSKDSQCHMKEKLKGLVEESLSSASKKRNGKYENVNLFFGSVLFPLNVFIYFNINRSEKIFLGYKKEREDRIQYQLCEHHM
jgi:hypothetical protein